MAVDRASKTARRWLAITLTVLSLGVPVILWQVNAMIQQNPVLAPGLGRIWDTMVSSANSGDLWYNASVSIRSGLEGLLLAAVLGVALGVLMAQSRLASAIVSPFLSATYPVPKLALYPVFILMLGLGTLPVVVLVALECMYPIAYNTLQGVQSTNKELVRAAANADAGRWRTFTAVQVPSALPAFLTGLRISVPIMVVVTVVVEMLGQSRGLGFLIRDAGRTFEPSQALGVILLLGVLGFVLDQLLQVATRQIVFWEARSDA
ncbi:ABC transporter permease [Nocardioides terrisoli]|uniref:ABC transporter permease n=1 Tax=Nocardioides terrisoli TaxID=3388267 RepID=UPI00287B667F|nr:ABC transporter permease [Nocardioides marmorisolisilvae]